MEIFQILAVFSDVSIIKLRMNLCFQAAKFSAMLAKVLLARSRLAKKVTGSNIKYIHRPDSVLSRRACTKAIPPRLVTQAHSMLSWPIIVLVSTIYQ
jgi:hypothetical protein